MNTDSEASDKQHLLDSLAMPVETKARDSGSRWRLWLLIAASAAAGIALWWQLSAQTSVVPSPEDLEPGVAVIAETDPIAEPESDTGERVLQASGFVVARRQATVSADVTGRLVKIHVREGATVEKGQLLAELDPRVAQARVDYARVNVESARKVAVVSKARLAEAGASLARYRKLAEDKFVSPEELDAASYKVDILKAQLASDRTLIQAAEKQFEIERQQLSNTQILAPFDGVVTQVTAHVGEIVSPISAGGGYTRTGICTLVDLDSIEGEINISEQYIDRLREGQKVSVTTVAYPDESFSGKVLGITPMVERNTAAIKVRVGLQGGGHRLIPGMRIDLDFLSSPGSEKNNS
ncbi:efflux RND transporter periplasmic adaptor subunit [Microbulbifer sp. 2205BS26-8]|uniref:efflux RND transporter periplasmic adaptor subunit n=1 Tax=Microbulbifer sp. 2205BS26-8 TaxID=3064386 RepID=UPI00273FF4B4|nr:efflux RND transporter periplasmic adaptor subunit [Microbulbifer sp. 2205BS26-8]MDP5210788.1 efflux RND transporter periplasmic adaptor subunit [Microbulbifer sp. 2205BS26-8]